MKYKSIYLVIAVSLIWILKSVLDYGGFDFGSLDWSIAFFTSWIITSLILWGLFYLDRKLIKKYGS